jgi:DNA-binding NarL/FixJ family response regulator
MNWRTAAYRALQAAFVLALLALLYSNWKLRREFAEISSSKQAPNHRTAPSPFRAGEVAPQLHVRDASGRALILDPAALPRESFLVFALPECASCGIELLHAAQSGQKNFTVVGLVAKDASASLIKEIPPGVSVYFLERVDTPRMREHIDNVPTILRLGPNGIITAVCHSMTDCGPRSASCPTCAL